MCLAHLCLAGSGASQVMEIQTLQGEGAGGAVTQSLPLAGGLRKESPSAGVSLGSLLIQILITNPGSGLSFRKET